MTNKDGPGLRFDGEAPEVMRKAMALVPRVSGLPAPVSAAASPSATPTTTPPSPSPTPTMTRKEACQQVVESAVDWVHLASRFSEDPTLESINSIEVSGLADKIRETLPYLDDATAELARDMMYPLDILYGVMTTGVNQTIELEEGRSAVPDVMRKCRGKANLKRLRVAV